MGYGSLYSPERFGEYLVPRIALQNKCLEYPQLDVLSIEVWQSFELIVISYVIASASAHHMSKHLRNFQTLSLRLPTPSLTKPRTHHR